MSYNTLPAELPSHVWAALSALDIPTSAMRLSGASHSNTSELCDDSARPEGRPRMSLYCAEENSTKRQIFPRVSQVQFRGAILGKDIQTRWWRCD